jgi:hypothetical protein
MTPSLSKLLARGTVIPAHPLALDENRKFDEKHQIALTRYYIDAGAGGLAVGVHTTQFEIREPEVGLFEPVLRLASETVDAYAGDRPIWKIAGICGKTVQAIREAEFAKECGYHAGLLSVAALKEETIPELIEHCRKVAEVIPVVGFYLQPAVGGRLLPYSFWREFASIENVIGIKMAPFNRYQTIDVIRGVCESDRANEIALYTGNDDNIVADLLTEYRIKVGSEEKRVRIVGGLLGHWACWTKGAVDLLNEVHALVDSREPIPTEWLTRNIDVTDANAALFDVANGFAGCIAGIHEVLRRQGLLKGTWCLNPNEQLSPGQSEEIDRVYAAYPEMNDDVFVEENLDRWLA